ncbi:hypothetical protein BU063_11090, partial [Staphylococcus succinus]|uniref:hypothetical protein n=1 Tax=Staphylococcus succinus TaxID=61015 RepID=UPI000FF23E27
LLISIVGVIIAQIFEFKDPWILCVVIIMPIISIIKNMFCMKIVIDKNEELSMKIGSSNTNIKYEYYRFSR